MEGVSDFDRDRTPPTGVPAPGSEPRREKTGSHPRRERTGSSRVPDGAMPPRERTGSSRVAPRPASTQGARVRFPPPLVFVSLIVLGGVLQQQMRFFLKIPDRACLAVGLTIVAGGIALAVWAFTLFRASGQDPRPWKPKDSLLAGGPYVYTRNPMYLGMTLVQLGIAIALNNLWVLLLTPVALALVHVIAVVPEEKYLEEAFGDDYRRYKAAVRRY